MYLCLSSASREGYSKDVVDTLAAPPGSERQFRYDKKWVEPGLQSLVEQGRLPDDAPCLLCFVDLRGKPQKPFILPLREAFLTRVISVGSTFTLVFKLGAFRRPADLMGFSKSAREKLPELHRFKKEKGALKPSGFLWIDAKDHLKSNLTQDSTKNWALNWENIVGDYLEIMNAPAKYSGDFLDKASLATDDQKFKDQSPFYVFYALKAIPEGNALESATENGRSSFQLKSGTIYELSFFHYHPNKSFPKVSLKLTASSDAIRFIGNSEHEFNTRYDVKRFMFSTTSLLTGAMGNILVSRVFNSGNSKEEVADTYVNFDIQRNLTKIVLYALAIAAAFAIPQLLVLAKGTPPADNATYVVVIIAAVALGFLTTMKDFLKLK